MELVRTSFGLCLMIALVAPQTGARAWSSRDPSDRDDYASSSAGRYGDADRDTRDSRDSAGIPDDSDSARHYERSSRYETDRGYASGEGDRPSRARGEPRARYGDDTDRESPRGRLASRWSADEAADVAGDDESRRHDSEMGKLENKLDDAERAENSRKVRAIQWEISRENKRHEENLAKMQSSRGRSSSLHRGATFGSRAGRGDEGPGYDSDRAEGERRAAYGGDDVQNPLRERSRRQREDAHAYGPRPHDDASDSDSGDFVHHARGMVSDRVADADGPIHRRW